MELTSENHGKICSAKCNLNEVDKQFYLDEKYYLKNPHFYRPTFYKLSDNLEAAKIEEFLELKLKQK